MSVQRAIERKQVVVLHPGVYAFRGAPATWKRSLMAACLAAGGGAVVSHRAAAVIWGLHDDEVVEITVRYPKHPRVANVRVHRSRDLVPAHTLTWNRLPLTNPLRTIVDLGAVLRSAQVEDALDRGLAKRLFSVAAVEWMRNEVGRQGRAGAGVLGRVLDGRALGAAVPDGLLEPRMARLLRSAGLPAAVFQHVITAPDGSFLARVDFAYPELLLAIEVDGYEVHGSPAAMAKDFVRQNGLVRYGWHVLRFTWTQVVRTPGAVAAAVAEALAGLSSLQRGTA